MDARHSTTDGTKVMWIDVRQKPAIRPLECTIYFIWSSSIYSPDPLFGRMHLYHPCPKWIRGGWQRHHHVLQGRTEPSIRRRCLLTATTVTLFSVPAERAPRGCRFLLRRTCERYAAAGSADRAQGEQGGSPCPSVAGANCGWPWAAAISDTECCRADRDGKVARWCASEWVRG